MPFCLLHGRTRHHFSLRTPLDSPTSNDLVSARLRPSHTPRLTEHPVLLILDRNIDLIPMLSHGWTYQALASDCLEMKLNRVVISQPQKRSYDLDSKDFFWSKNAANPFPQVAEDIDTELNRYKQDAAEITRSTGVSDVNDIAQMSVSSISAILLSRLVHHDPFASVQNMSLTLPLPLLITSTHT